MNSSLSQNSLRFIVLLLAQVTVCSNINLFGYINPFIYIIFILLFPVNDNKMLFLFLAFLLGISIDFFLDSGGAHAGASVMLAFTRPIFLKYAFGSLYDHHNLKFNQVDISALLLYIILCVLCHHFILFILEIFNIFQILLTLKLTLFSSIFSIILSFLLILLFKNNK